MKEVWIAGLFTAFGACIGFAGTLIQSVVSARNNRKLISLQAQSEILNRRYFEKEKLYSEIIAFLPQVILAINVTNGKPTIHLSKEQKILLNSFKPRLLIYSSREISDRFYGFFDEIDPHSFDEDKAIHTMNEITDILIDDLKISNEDYKRCVKEENKKGEKK